MVTYIDTGGSINVATNVNCTYPIVVAQSGLVWRFVVKTKQDCESVPVNDLGRRDATPSTTWYGIHILARMHGAKECRYGNQRDAQR